MRIRPFLNSEQFDPETLRILGVAFENGEQFDQETLRILGVAFEQVCIGLRIGDCGDDVKNAIAKKIIELAHTGERNPDRLCERALKDMC